jgi:hypothetical protein
VTAPTKTDRIIAALAAPADNGCMPLDFVEEWIGSGQTLLALADSLSASMGEPVRRDALSRLVYQFEGAHNRLTEARRRGADALVDQAAKLMDEAPTDSREALAKTVKQVEFRQWLAERSNPGNWGGQRQNVNVGINLTLGELHLRSKSGEYTRVMMLAHPIPVITHVVDVPRQRDGFPQRIRFRKTFAHWRSIEHAQSHVTLPSCFTNGFLPIRG